MGAVTKAELDALVKRQEKSLDRADAKIATLDKSLERAKTKIKAHGKSLRDARAHIVGLEKSVAEGRGREKATAEILRVISQSPTDVGQVFQSVAERAASICDATNARIFLIEGDKLRCVCEIGGLPGGANAGALLPLDRGWPTGRAVIAATVMHIEDVKALPFNDYPIAREFQEKYGHRTILAVPLMRDKQALGAILLRRMDVRPFGDEQIALLKTFADQAVIAIENARLFNETNEALEQQTVISEILHAISNSPTDTQPVFDAIVKSGVQLFGGMNMTLRLVRGEHHVTVAATTPMSADTGGEWPIALSDMGSTPSRAIARGEVTQVEDVLARTDSVSPLAKKRAELRGFRAVMSAPLLREGRAIGAVNVTRATPGAFTDKQIALLQTFATQAVIAIENARLFKELEARNAEVTESLERQTATSEILKVIASSPTDVQPVFDAIVRSGAPLFRGMTMSLRLVRGEYAVLAASSTPESAGTGEAKPAALADLTTKTARAIAQCEVQQIADVFSEDAAVGPSTRERAQLRGWRAGLFAPMVREGRAIGTVNVLRANPGPFSDKEIALLQTFADQAVIAIENVRLFKELQARNAELTESLEQQTATAEILRVISSSPTDIRPVLEAVADNAARLCAANDVVIRLVDGDLHHGVAHHGQIPMVGPLPIRGSIAGRAMLDRKTMQIEDLHAPSVRVEFQEADATAGWYRTFLSAPLMREGAALGAIVMRREQVLPFTDKQIELLETFAAQAVIAIENVRLFNELQAKNAELTESLEQQTATSAILKVISSSPTDLQPVFDVILENATRLCDAQRGLLGLFDGEKYAYLAVRGVTPERREVYLNWGPRIPVEGTNLWRMISERRPIHVHDLANNPQVRSPVPVALNEGVRTLLAVPMLKEGRVVGGIIITRLEVRPFTQEQIDLVSTFASQAVIAIENVRLFKELQAQTEALSRSVSQLTALGEVGQAISSTLDLETVLKTIVSRALQLTGLDSGSIYEYDQQAQVFGLQATENIPEEIIKAVRTSPIRTGDGVVGRTGVTHDVVQVPDILDPSYRSERRDLLVHAGYRALLAVPLLREDQLLGVLLVHRKSPGEFAPEIVNLLKTFATQSALAIQNARLFREIAEKGRQLEIASQHKSQFLASMSHELRTPLNAMLGFNEMILGELYGPLPEDLKEPLGDIQSSGKHLLRLINNVLDLAKIEAGRMELSLSDYSPHDIVESVRSTLHPLAAEKGLEFAVDIAEDIPFAHGDFGRLTQCLMNLAGNSLKFTREGSVRITVDLSADRLVFRVVDTGIGIAPDKIDSLFTEFKQTDATIASEFGGTGLGLSITKKFVEMHGGRIWVESELGEGSAFIFEIPLHVGEEAKA